MSRLLAKSEPMHTKQTSKLGTPSACSAASSVQSAICALGDGSLVFVDDHDLVAQLRQLEAEVTAKAAQADDKNGFHNGTS